MIWPRLLADMIGYLIAVLVADFITVALILALSALPDNGALGSFASYASEVGAMLAIGFVWTFFCALPGYVFAVLIGHSNDWSKWWHWGLAGMGNAGLALVIFSWIGGSPSPPEMWIGAFPGGLAGGTAYWLTAGRWIAWRRRINADETAA